MPTEKNMINTVLAAWRKELEILGMIVENSLEFVNRIQKIVDGLEKEGEADAGTS